MYRDRAYCLRSRGEWTPHGVDECANTACDRFADENVLRLAAKAKLSIGWADLMTSKCGFEPREDER